MSSSNSPCAACKCLRRKCTHECVFAPYFPPDNPQKFTNVHKVFGASNVAKLLNELNPNHRGDAVNSLAYEAEYRLRDPVYGCVGLISILQHKLKQVQLDLDAAKKELAGYITGQPGFFPQHSSFGPSPSFQITPYGTGIPMGDLHGSDLSRFDGGFDVGMCSVAATAFNPAAAMHQPALALGGSYDNVGPENPHQLQPQAAAEVFLFQPPRGAKSEVGGSDVGPSC